MDMKEAHEAGINAIIKEAEEIDWVQALFGTGIGSAQQLFEAQMRAYLDASGMVMVPASPTEEMVTAWKVAFHEAYDGGKGVGTYDENIRFGLEASLINAPNPFQTPEESREKK